MAKEREAAIIRERSAAGYLSSALAFAGITALWAVIVRDDPYYRLVDLFGARVPLTMLAYLVIMPLIGAAIGSWRYEAAHQGGFTGLIGKLSARAVHFAYAHLLLVVFTVAMITDHFLGLNIDDQIKRIDDRLFDIGARFAPWLAAYLAGFNLGRALRRNGHEAHGVANADRASHSSDAVATPQKPPKTRRTRSSKGRAEPVIDLTAEMKTDAEVRGDLSAAPAEEPPPATFAAQSHDAPPTDGESGFLPPQDLNKLRPTLRDLR